MQQEERPMMLHPSLVSYPGDDQPMDIELPQSLPHPTGDDDPMDLSPSLVPYLNDDHHTTASSNYNDRPMDWLPPSPAPTIHDIDSMDVDAGVASSAQFSSKLLSSLTIRRQSSDFGTDPTALKSPNRASKRLRKQSPIKPSSSQENDPRPGQAVAVGGRWFEVVVLTEIEVLLFFCTHFSPLTFPRRAYLK